MAVSNQLLDVGRGGGWAKVKYGVRSPKFIWASGAQVHRCTHWLIYEGAIGQQNRRHHLFVTLWRRAECFGDTVELLMLERGGANTT